MAPANMTLRILVIYLGLSLGGCGGRWVEEAQSLTIAPTTPELIPSPPQEVAPEADTARQIADWSNQFAAVLVGQSDTLSVEHRPISVDQIERLQELMPNLKQLWIESGGVDDAAMRQIGQLKNLVHLRIRIAILSDLGLANLVSEGLPNLQILNIPQARFTATGIAKLKQLPKLSNLRIGGKQLDDLCVAELAQMTELRSLHLIGPGLSDAALSLLGHSPKLSSFYLDDCPLSDSAWETLFSAKPKLHVHVDQHHHDRDPNPDVH